MCQKEWLNVGEITLHLLFLQSSGDKSFVRLPQTSHLSLLCHVLPTKPRPTLLEATNLCQSSQLEQCSHSLNNEAGSIKKWYRRFKRPNIDSRVEEEIWTPSKTRNKYDNPEFSLFWIFGNRRKSPLTYKLC